MSAPIQVQVNGVPRTAARGSTIATLVAEVGAHPEGVAVAVNGAVVPRAQHARTALKDGDRVEIIRAVGGG
jgi:sulfur carrier protein